MDWMEDHQLPEQWSNIFQITTSINATANISIQTTVVIWTKWETIDGKIIWRSNSLQFPVTPSTISTIVTLDY